MNIWIRLFVFGVIVGVVTCQWLERRRTRPRPRPRPPVCTTDISDFCGGFAGATCPIGYTCRYRPGADFGDCCPDRASCPRPTGWCMFPRRRCRRDRDCRRGRRCCPDGCGRRVCLRVFSIG